MDGITQLASVSAINATANLRLFLYWERRKLGRCAPRREDVDLDDFAKIIEGIGLLEVVEDGRDYRIAFAGPGVLALAGKNAVGRCLSEYDDSIFKARTLYLADQVRLEKTPYINHPERTYHPDKTYTVIESVALPLFDGDHAVSHVLTGSNLIVNR